MPRGHTHVLAPMLVALHASSNSLIVLSYVAISLTIGYMICKACRGMPFHCLIMAIFVVIIASAGTYLMDELTLWNPAYWVSGTVRLVAACSVAATAIVLPSMAPKVLDIVRTAREAGARKKTQPSPSRPRHDDDNPKTRFAETPGSDLHTPLRLILGSVQKLLEEKKIPAAEQQHLRMVEQNASILLHHVNALPALSRPDATMIAPHPTATDLVPLLHRMVSHFEMLATKHRIGLHVATPPSVPAVIDREKIEQVLMNLLSGAFAEIADGGIIACSLEVHEGNAHINIQNSRSKTPEKTQPARSDRFGRHHQEGAHHYGDGSPSISIAREFVEFHGGTLRLSDAPQGNNRWTITLPLTEAMPTAPQADAQTVAIATGPIVSPSQQPPQAAPPADTDRPLVLVVADNHDSATAIAHILAEEFRVITAFNGDDGYRRMLEEQPDLIVSDVAMAESGDEHLVQRIRRHKEFAAMPILLLTAQTDDEALMERLGENVQDHLDRPFEPQELQTRAHHLVRMNHPPGVPYKSPENRLHDIAEPGDRPAGPKADLPHTPGHPARNQIRLHHIIEANIVGIFFADSQGTVLEANDLFLRMVDYDRNDLLAGDISWKGLTPEEHHHTGTQGGFHTINAPKPLETVYIRKDGRHLPVLAGTVLLAAADPEYATFVIDLSEQKQMQQDLQKARETAESASRAKDHFLAILSHELLTPLTPALMAVHALHNDPATSNDGHILLTIIENNIAIEVRLIEDLLDMTRLASGTMRLDLENVQAHSILLDTIAPLQTILAGKNLALDIRLGAEFPHTLANPLRLQQAFRNILKNAAKFTPSGGSITISSRNDTTQQLLIIEVKDTGIGIAPEVLTGIFAPFQQGEQSITRKFGGLGLGLALSKRIIEMMGGTLQVESPGENMGTVFSITLPTAK